MKLIAGIFFFVFCFFFWGATSRDGRYAARDRSHAPTNSEQQKKNLKKKYLKRKQRGRCGGGVGGGVSRSIDHESKNGRATK